MKQYLIEKVFDLENKCLEQSKEMVKRYGSIVELNDFCFYVVYSGNDSAVCVCIKSVEYDKNNDVLIMRGNDYFGNDYVLDEGDDIINFASFDLFNTLCQFFSTKDLHN